MYHHGMRWIDAEGYILVKSFANCQFFRIFAQNIHENMQ